MMVFIDSLWPILIFINLLYYARADDCTTISDFFVDQNLFVFNSTESVVFLPTRYYFDNHTDSVSGLLNGIDYKGKVETTLSKSDLNIDNDELTNAIRQSLNSNEMFKDVINVFPNRFVTKADSAKIKIFSIKFGITISVDKEKGCDGVEMEYYRSIIRGMICKISFISGARYNIKCGSIKLYLLLIDGNGKLDVKIKCKT